MVCIEAKSRFLQSKMSSKGSAKSSISWPCNFCSKCGNCKQYCECKKCAGCKKLIREWHYKCWMCRKDKKNEISNF